MNTQESNIYEAKGLCGLINLGNTCFMNSCLQILSHSYELTHLLEEQQYKKKLKQNVDAVLLLEWDNLRKILWEENNQIIQPNKFLYIVQNVAKHKGRELFTGYDQNDLQEFLIYIIDCFHNAISREIKISISGTPENETDVIAIKCYQMIKDTYSLDYSEIWNLFYGVHVSTIQCIKTQKILSIKPEPYFIIDLPIPNSKFPSFIDCLELYLKGEILEGENAWYNEETNTYIAIEKKISMWSFPSILVITFKRFNNHNQKIQKKIDFPIEDLNLSNYVIGYKKETYRYELYGIINHSGSVLGGHYTCYIRNKNNQWYEFNDSKVAMINVENVITPKAYCLFYRKKK
jgi:ubiquitin C-terminal hydrolase